MGHGGAHVGRDGPQRDTRGANRGLGGRRDSGGRVGRRRGRDGTSPPPSSPPQRDREVGKKGTRRGVGSAGRGREGSGQGSRGRVRGKSGPTSIRAEPRLNKQRCSYVGFEGACLSVGNWRGGDRRDQTRGSRGGIWRPRLSGSRTTWGGVGCFAVRSSPEGGGREKDGRREGP